MAQRVLFPMEYLRITQPELYTGKNATHQGSLAIDFGGEKEHPHCDKVYAPCDMVYRERTVNLGSNELYFDSLNEVECANGDVCYVHFTFMHDDVLNFDFSEGQIFFRGEHFMEEGTYQLGSTGEVLAHLHMEAGKVAASNTEVGKYVRNRLAKSQ